MVGYIESPKINGFDVVNRTFGLFAFAWIDESNPYYDGRDFDPSILPDNLKPIYFPKKFKTLFKKLIRCEHNRWISCHYMDGWRYNKQKNKLAKE